LYRGFVAVDFIVTGLIVGVFIDDHASPFNHVCHHAPAPPCPGAGTRLPRQYLPAEADAAASQASRKQVADRAAADAAANKGGKKLRPSQVRHKTYRQAGAEAVQPQQ